VAEKSSGDSNEIWGQGKGEQGKSTVKVKTPRAVEGGIGRVVYPPAHTGWTSLALGTGSKRFGEKGRMAIEKTVLLSEKLVTRDKTIPSSER